MRPHHPLPVESVADILERSTQSTIEDWLQSVRDEPGIISVHLDDDVRAPTVCERPRVHHAVAMSHDA